MHKQRLYSKYQRSKDHRDRHPSDPEVKKDKSLIRHQHQQAIIQKTVQDQPCHTLSDIYVEMPKTPQYSKGQPPGPSLSLENGHLHSFKMDDCFDNKHLTVKKEYLEPFSSGKNKDVTLDREEVCIKENNRKAGKGQYQRIMSKSRKKEKEKEKHENEKGENVMSGNGVLTLRDGWLYKGEYVSNLFHGFGSLYHHNQLIYSGNFEFGYFHGHGKLQYHPSFDYLIQLKTVHTRLNTNSNNNSSQEESQWTAYFGEFSKGNISGYGQLWTSTAQKIAGRWSKGSIKGQVYVVTESPAKS